MKKVITVLACMVISFIFSVQISALSVNPNYVGAYERTDNSTAFIDVQSSDVVCVKVRLSSSQFVSAGNCNSLIMQLNQFATTYSSYMEFTSMTSSGTYKNVLLPVQGTFNPTTKRIVINSLTYQK